MPSPEVRKGMPSVKLGREEFEKRFKSRFVEPACMGISGGESAVCEGKVWIVLSVTFEGRSPSLKTTYQSAPAG